MKINGVELEDLDIYDLEVAEKYETGLKKIQEVDNNLTGKSMSESIKVQCVAVNEFFNSMFGEETDKKIFGDKLNLMTSMKAFDEFISQMNEQKSNMDKIVSKYSPNRASRRSKK